MTMHAWPALIIAPLIALAQQSIMYALVPPACDRHTVVLLHLAGVVAIGACAALTWGALKRWRATRPPVGQDAQDEQRPHTLALVAVMAGGLSTLVCATMWAPVWMVSPCAI
jgi:hypothetical protein